MSERLIDQERIKAQIDLANRITKGGEIDMDKAVQERRNLAARIENKRGAYLNWLKSQGWPREAIDAELAEFDKLVANLYAEPFSEQALQIGEGALGF